MTQSGNSGISIHKIIKTAKSKDDLKGLLDENENYVSQHFKNKKNRTLLHVAVISGKPREILEYLVINLHIDITSRDYCGYTALHYACKGKYDENFEETYKLLKGNSENLLISQSNDDVTPLELACNDIKKLKVIENLENENLKKLLEKIDNVSENLPKTNGFYIACDKRKTEIWIDLLNRNADDLIYFLKNNTRCTDKYYLSSNEFYEILSNCSDNGNGILNFIKMKDYFNEESKNDFTEKLYHELTGFKIPNIKNLNNPNRFYYNSVLFLSLITGRFQLIFPLLRFCQFHIILYGLLTCLICNKLTKLKLFSDELKKNFYQTKDFCENYSIVVLNLMAIKESTLDEYVVFNFLTNKEKFTGKRILDIAFLGNCSNFLCLPACQRSLTEIWKKGHFCPAAKFYLNSLYHLLFLILFAYILINELYFRISIPELICYIYGFGYLFEILNHFINCFLNNFLDYYINDPVNYLDISATIVLLFTGVLRYILSKIHFIHNRNEKNWKIIENDDKYLYLTRLCLCFSFAFYSMKVIYFGFNFKLLGPKLKMISRMMVTDLIPVIFVFLIFIISFGIAFECLLFPNSFININTDGIIERKPVQKMIIDIFKRSTFTIFDAHYCLEEISNRNNEQNLDQIREMSAYLLFFVYIVIVNVMIMNLLIAIFSNTVTVIIEKSRISWKAERYKNIHDYLDHSFSPPPFNILEIVFRFLKKKCKHIVDEADFGGENCSLEFNSFEILQAFSLKNCRYKLLRTDEDKEHQRKIEIENIKKNTNKINETLESIKAILVKKGLIQEKQK